MQNHIPPHLREPSLQHGCLFRGDSAFQGQFPEKRKPLGDRELVPLGAQPRLDAPEKMTEAQHGIRKGPGLGDILQGGPPHLFRGPEARASGQRLLDQGLEPHGRAPVLGPRGRIPRLQPRRQDQTHQDTSVDLCAFHALSPILAQRSRREFDTTETELNAMAAAAKMGLSSTPKKGYRTPAAMGMPAVL